MHRLEKGVQGALVEPEHENVVDESRDDSVTSEQYHIPDVRLPGDAAVLPRRRLP